MQGLEREARRCSTLWMLTAAHRDCGLGIIAPVLADVNRIFCSQRILRLWALRVSHQHAVAVAQVTKLCY
jgi:hypothetical protein